MARRRLQSESSHRAGDSVSGLRHRVDQARDANAVDGARDYRRRESRDHANMMGGYNDGWAMAMWFAMAAFWLLVFGVVAWLVWTATQFRSETSSAADILKQRLARGE